MKITFCHKLLFMVKSKLLPQNLCSWSCHKKIFVTKIFLTWNTCFFVTTYFMAKTYICCSDFILVSSHFSMEKWVKLYKTHINFVREAWIPLNIDWGSEETKKYDIMHKIFSMQIVIPNMRLCNWTYNYIWKRIK